MKTFFLALLLCVTASAAFSQSPTYEQKLYYSCKVWGFVKYYHSRVSNCLVPWDDVLTHALPLIKAAATVEEFNDVLDTLIVAAGQMADATTPSPDTLAPELTRNRDFSWLDDPLLREDIRSKLRYIKENFRPHPICWVKDNDGSTGLYGWLLFPYDTPCMDLNVSKAFPDEPGRLLMLFNYWNIIEYFNLNRHLADTPWDTLLVRHCSSIAAAGNYLSLTMEFRRLASALNDAHVTVSTAMPSTGGYYAKVVASYIQDGYRIVKSGIPELNVGDKVISIDGHSIGQLEDSLRPILSAGNPAAFRRLVGSRLFSAGEVGSPMSIEYIDSLGAIQSLIVRRYTPSGNSWFIIWPNDSLHEATWRTLDCNVGYVNMGNLQPDEISAMYAALKDTKTIIFDIRNYPQNTIWGIAQLMFPKRMWTTRLTVPDVLYPGTSFWASDSAGMDAVHQPYRGRVIILCNQETWSHAEYSCMILRAMPDVVVVGSQTMGADGNLSVIRVSQDIQTTFTTLGVYYPDGTLTQRIGIVPDSVVLPTAAGIRHNRDEVLEKAMEIAGCPAAVGVQNLPAPAAESLPMMNVYPNPFSASTTLEFSHPITGYVVLKVVDLNGREVLDVSDRIVGQTSLTLQHWQFPSPGVYFISMQHGGQIRISAVYLLR